MDNDPNKVIELSNDEINELVENKSHLSVYRQRRGPGQTPRSKRREQSARQSRGRQKTGQYRWWRSWRFARGVCQRQSSLEFPGSQGSHPGHSGILQGDPEIPRSGRLSQAEFARLASRAKDGLIKRSDVGSFIAENLLKDPKSKVFGIHTTALLANDLLAFVPFWPTGLTPRRSQISAVFAEPHWPAQPAMIGYKL
jgi:hypothetical protein